MPAPARGPGRGGGRRGGGLEQAGGDGLGEGVDPLAGLLLELLREERDLGLGGVVGGAHTVADHPVDLRLRGRLGRLDGVRAGDAPAETDGHEGRRSGGEAAVGAPG
ncbi:hypothetical protein [Corynebacterium bovis]|uniref:hypothetical protein n=1 Tax=Corynebacterium bovis TaxID=36808 RepID=UPI0039F66AD7